MGILRYETTMSLDGFTTGPDPGFEHPLGIAGGANVAQQYLRAGLLDELLLHVVPVPMGEGVRTFEDHVADGQVELESTQVVQSPAVTHLRYRVAR
jgi:dihydrofolate reductase